MKLKAIILATGLINCIAFSAQAVDTTITVTGRVLPRTCTIGNGGNPNATVVLDNAYTSDLIAANSTSQWKNFSLTLTNCQNVNNVTATFGGTAEIQIITEIQGMLLISWLSYRNKVMVIPP